MKKSLIFAGLLLFLSAGCKKAKVEKRPGKKLVVASIAPLTAIAREVGDTLFDYRYIVPRSSNPHTFEPTPGDMKAVEKSSLFIYVGLKLDPWAQKMASYAPLSLAVGDSLKNYRLPLDNPHDIWLAPRHVKASAAIIASALEDISPKNKSTIEFNLRDFYSRIDSLMDYIAAQRVDTIRVVVYHGAWAGVLEELGFDVVDVIAQNPAQEPSLSRISEVIERAKERGVSVVVAEANFPDRVPSKVAEAVGARLVKADPLYERDYVSTLKALIDSVFRE